MLRFNEVFTRNDYEDSNEGYILEVDVEYPKDLHDLHSDLPFLPEMMKINKYDKLVCNLHRVIKFNQTECLKSYIGMNTKLRTKAKYNFEKDFFKLMNNSIFGKTMENAKKHRDIKLVTTNKR